VFEIIQDRSSQSVLFRDQTTVQENTVEEELLRFLESLVCVSLTPTICPMLRKTNQKTTGKKSENMSISFLN
jgi:hypothetical protein